MQGTCLSVHICPKDPEGIDVKFAVELGISIMLDKPSVVVANKGTKVPEKLRKIADRVVEVDLKNLVSDKTLTTAIQDVLKERGLL